MSFDVFLCCFENGEPAGIRADRLRQAFGSALVREDPGVWRVQYGREIDSCEVYFSPEAGSRISSMTVNRPLRDERLWNSLFEIMQLGNVVLFFPGGPSPFVARERAREHLPAALIESLGPPVLVEGGSDIRAAIEGT